MLATIATIKLFRLPQMKRTVSDDSTSLRKNLYREQLNLRFPPPTSFKYSQLSQQRRSQKRQWYHLKLTKEMQQCPHCNAVGANNNLLSELSGGCNGMCLQGRPQKSYSPEYKPPC